MVQISFGKVLEKTVIRDKLVMLQSSFHTMAFLSLLIKAHFTSKTWIHHTQNKETKQHVRLRTMAWYWISHTLGMGGWSASAVVWLTFWHLFGPVQFNSRWYLGALKSPYALYPVSQKFPQCCLWNSSNVCLIDDGPLLSFQWRPSSTSEFIHIPPLSSSVHVHRQPWEVERYCLCLMFVATRCYVISTWVKEVTTGRISGLAKLKIQQRQHNHL